MQTQAEQHLLQQLTRQAEAEKVEKEVAEAATPKPEVLTLVEATRHAQKKRRENP